MRRILLALAISAGLAIGTVVPASALDTSVTLKCSDGTSVPLVVDANTLTALTAAVQSMLDYPAGLTCSLIQNPLGSFFGHVALAGAGQNPFVVGGGRWQWPFPCEPTPHPLDGSEVAKVPGTWSYEPIFGSPTREPAPTTLVWVNIAVNAHVTDPNDPTTAFGTLNETIPTQDVTCPAPQGTFTLNERHFTSTPTCLKTGGDATTSRTATVTSHVTQSSGSTLGITFPEFGTDTHFSFIDNGNPSQGLDFLQGPPAGDDSTCPTFGTPPTFLLANGNISIRNAQ